MSLTHREEKILEAVIDGSSVPFDPVTRREKIFAKAAGEDIELAPPITKEEQILSALAAKGSGGGGGSSDFSTAEVTVVTAEGSLPVPIKTTNPLDGSDCSQAIFMNEVATYTVILYKGKLFTTIENPEEYYIEKVSGAVEIIDYEGVTGVAAVITGDCSINIKHRAA